MKLTGATHLLAVLLIATNPQGLVAQEQSRSRILFENADFKIYSVRDPEVLPLISKPANFGVLLLREEAAAFVHNDSFLYFSGSSGQRSLLGYGTPGGAASFIDKTGFRNAGTDLIWVVPKMDAEITEPVFKKDLPDSFTKSVREDLSSIGSLADRAAVGQQPYEKELARARAAINDLSFKSRWFSLHSGTSAPPSLVCVTVRTVREGQELDHWTVWYVLLGWEGDKDHTTAFDKQSSPTNPQCIPPGNYKMWATQGKKIGSAKQVPVGDNPDKNKELDLEVP
jgi:hypothetical protein